MFKNLHTPRPDKIIEMISLYKADTRTDKIDLGVGVYKNNEGVTPVMQAVKEAEKKLWETQTSKSYVSLNGQVGFLDAMAKIALGEDHEPTHIAAIQTPGGTGAIRQLYELIQLSNPNAVFHISDPSWPNHSAILKFMGLNQKSYRYFNRETGHVDFEGMLEDLKNINENDVIILHGCCHNPTGANLTNEQWEIISKHIEAKGALALVDLAYQGFGDGLEADANGLRILATNVSQFMLAQSCSKNFGIYRDRVGMALVHSKNAKEITKIQANLNTINRVNYSFPPDHGAAVVEALMNDEALVKTWKSELENIRLEILDKRMTLANCLRLHTNSDRFDFIAEHRGMFSLSGLSIDEINQLRDNNGIYIVPDSRINLAGLQTSRIEDLAIAISRVVCE